ncbi:hypothetical protein Tco_1296488, partial [Tanacetum coccineum]
MESHGDASKREGTTGRVIYDDLRACRGEMIVGENSIRGIASSFSKVIDEMNRSTTYHADKVNGISYLAATKGTLGAAINDSKIIEPNVQTHNIDSVAALFGVSFNSCIAKDLEFGKHELWSVMTKEKRLEIMDIIFSKWDALLTEAESIPKGAPIVDDNMSSKVLPNDPIVQSIYVHKKPNSYVGAAGGPKLKPSKAKANFCPLFSDNLCKCANVSIPKKLVETNIDELQRLFLFTVQNFKRVGGCSIERAMDDSCNFARCLIEINADNVLKESLTIGVPLIEGLGFTIESINIEYEWKPPWCDHCKIFCHIHDYCLKKVLIPTTVVTPNVPNPTLKKTNDRFQTLGKNKKKGKSKSNIVGQIGGHPVKQNVRYEPKVTTSVPKKGATNVGNASQSSSMLKKQPTTTIASTKE